MTLQLLQYSARKLQPENAQVRMAGEHTLPSKWIGVLRGCVMDIYLAPNQILVRQLDFPKQAEPFLNGMIRSRIDRLTPWSAEQALFGFSEPQSVPNERIGLILAAVSRATVEPLVQFADHVGAATVAIHTHRELSLHPITLFSAGLRSAICGRRDLAKLLKFSLLGAATATALVLIITMVLGTKADGALQELRSTIARQRAAVRGDPSDAASTAETLLARRKQATPATVLVLDHLSSILPDGTYVTTLRVEGERLQLIGLTQDAPTLIQLIEQSPQFSRAAFFAPTTRSSNEPGERFHIEVRVNPYFKGST
ncbi:PilN domain-containing protein [Bradyrhizobium sp. ERR14]|uniref:PilN domain-containing protein n=1 Tax=Bradyrhizobium sp. ERR14 TaxID=2663837 RepID=UPI0017D12061|nr:PilN domain-containing protein [Bradyrhizobium sp. ERR14]MBB4398897.1 general secretion pathway protein L [Bradyrhizobium sp. ERR14]